MSGSKEGGLTLTIYGNYFDDRAPYTAPRAYIGGDAETQCSETDYHKINTQNRKIPQILLLLA